MTARLCLDCPTPISAVSKGRCRRCANAIVNRSPEHRAKSSAAMLRNHQDPIYRAAQSKRVTAGLRRAMKDPAVRDTLRENGRRYGSANIVATRGPESRAKAGKAISAAHLAHIPEAKRDEYRALKSKGLTRAERTEVVMLDQARERRDARQAVERAMHEQVEADQRRKAQAY